MKDHMQLQNIFARRPLAALGILTVVGLIGCALASGFLLLQIGLIIVPIVIVGLVLLAMAGLVATGIRWAPLLATCDALGTMIGGLVTQQYFSYHLTHPDQPGFFAAALLVYAFAFVAAIAGICATIQNYRSQDRPTPRLLAPLLTALGGFLVGAILVSLLSQANSVSAQSGSASGGSVIAHMGVNDFTPSTVILKKGSTLLLVDDGQFFHVITNGMWTNTTAHITHEAGAPAINSQQANGQGKTLTIGSFNTAGTFHIFCTVHPGMNLTVIVQ